MSDPRITLVIGLLLTAPKAERTAAGIARLFAYASMPVRCDDCDGELRVGFPVGCVMPGCGHRFSAQGPDDFPLVDTPCTCGDPTHWFVRFREDALHA